MLSRANVLLTFTRSFSRHRKQWQPEAVKYGLIKYYPRHPNEVDPPVTPSKLLMVTLVKKFKGNPYWDKRAMNLIGITEEMRGPVVVKNTPEMCSLLWSIKHLLEIKPIKLPEKLPELTDVTDTYLHENGHFYIMPNINPERREATEKHAKNPKRLDSATVSEKLRLMWNYGYDPY